MLLFDTADRVDGTTLSPSQDADLRAAILKIAGTNSQSTAESSVSINELVASIPSQHVHDILRHVDPAMADRWHPNESRKIRRSLQFYIETGRRYSSQLETATVQSCRYRTLIFWLHTDADRLKERLDRRVDVMLERGLMLELHEAWRMLQNGELGLLDASGLPDYRRGILQAIGFKEFDAYFQSMDSGLLDGCIDAMKRSTRQYANKQLGWIRNKLVRQISNVGKSESSPILYAIDPLESHEVWLDTATQLGLQFMSHKALPSAVSLAPVDMLATAQTSKPALNEWKAYTCDICQQTVHGPHEWTAHQKSRKHKVTKRLQNSPSWPFYQRHLASLKQQ
jgi:tRNA dimethylallyltransferase